MTITIEPGPMDMDKCITAWLARLDAPKDCDVCHAPILHHALGFYHKDCGVILCGAACMKNAVQAKKHRPCIIKSHGEAGDDLQFFKITILEDAR